MQHSSLSGSLYEQLKVVLKKKAEILQQNLAGLT